LPFHVLILADRTVDCKRNAGRSWKPVAKAIGIGYIFAIGDKDTPQQQTIKELPKWEN
jgi:hypothetical protein